MFWATAGLFEASEPGLYETMDGLAGLKRWGDRR